MKFNTEEESIKFVESSIFNIFNIDKECITDNVIRASYERHGVDVCLYMKHDIKKPEWLIKEMCYQNPLRLHALPEGRSIMNKLLVIDEGFDFKNNIDFINTLEDYYIIGILKYIELYNKLYPKNKPLRIIEKDSILKCSKRVQQIYMEYKLLK